jgi:hypothetical protein
MRRRLTVTNAIPGRVVVLSRGYRLAPGETVEWDPIANAWRLLDSSILARSLREIPTWRPSRP